MMRYHGLSVLVALGVATASCGGDDTAPADSHATNDDAAQGGAGPGGAGGSVGASGTGGGNTAGSASAVGGGGSAEGGGSDVIANDGGDTAAPRRDASTEAGASIEHPNASNTGPEAAGCSGLVTTAGEDIQSSGALPSWAKLQADGWVLIEGRAFTNPFQVYRTKVKIRCSTGSGAWAEGPFWALRGASDYVVEYTRVHATSQTQKLQYIVSTDASNVTLRYNDWYWWSDAVQLGGNNILVEGNYIHDQVYYSGDHTDAIQHFGGGRHVTIRHNTLEVSTPQTSPLALFQDGNAGSNSYDDVLVEDNLVAGGGYCFYAGFEKVKDPISNVRFRYNKLSTKFFPNCGSAGPVAAAPSWGQNGNDWSGNIWYDGPQKSKLAGP
jgi:hypothetical protein